MPTSLQSLDIATLVLFGPLLLLIICIFQKHTAKKDLPWFWLFLACALRIVAAAVGCVAADPQSPSKTRNEVTYIINSLVPIFLVVVLTEIINQLLSSLGNGRALFGLPSEKRSWVNAFALTAVIVGTIGGVRSYDNNMGTKLEGQKYCGIAATLIFAQLILVVGMIAFTIVLARRQGGMLPPGEWKLLICAAGSVPALFVRMVFGVCTAWAPNVEAFKFPSDKTGAMIVWAILGLAMEFAVATLYVVGGLLTPRRAEGEVRSEEVEREQESQVEVQMPKVDDGLERGYPKTGSEKI